MQSAGLCESSWEVPAIPWIFLKNRDIPHYIFKKKPVQSGDRQQGPRKLPVLPQILLKERDLPIISPKGITHSRVQTFMKVMEGVENLYEGSWKGRNLNEGPGNSPVQPQTLLKNRYLPIISSKGRSLYRLQTFAKILGSTENTKEDLWPSADLPEDKDLPNQVSQRNNLFQSADLHEGHGSSRESL